MINKHKLVYVMIIFFNVASVWGAHGSDGSSSILDEEEGATVDPTSQIIRCPLCKEEKKIYFNWRHFHNHLVSEHRKRVVFKCEMCGKDHCYKGGRDNHEDSICCHVKKGKTQNITCSCGKAFYTRNQLYRHLLDNGANSSEHKEENTSRPPYCPYVILPLIQPKVSNVVKKRQSSHATVQQSAPVAQTQPNPLPYSSAQAGYGNQGNSLQAPAHHASVGLSGFPTVQPPMGVMNLRPSLPHASYPIPSYTSQGGAVGAQAVGLVAPHGASGVHFSAQAGYGNQGNSLQAPAPRGSVGSSGFPSGQRPMGVMNLRPSLPHASYPIPSYTSQGGAVGAQAVGLVAPHGASGVHFSAQAGYGNQGNSLQAPAHHASVGLSGFPTVQPPMGVMPAARMMVQQSSQLTTSELLEMLKKALKGLKDTIASSDLKEKKQTLLIVKEAYDRIYTKEFQEYVSNRKPEVSEKLQEILQNLRKKNIHERLCSAQTNTLQNQILQELELPLLEIQEMVAVIDKMNLRPSLPHASYPIPSYTSQGGAVGAQAVGLVAPHGASGVHPSAQAGYGNQSNRVQAPAPHGSVGPSGFPTVLPPMGVICGTMQPYSFTQPNISEGLRNHLKEALESVRDGLKASDSRVKKEAVSTAAAALQKVSRFPKDILEKFEKDILEKNEKVLTTLQKALEDSQSIDPFITVMAQQEALIEGKELLEKMQGAFLEASRRMTFPPYLGHAASSYTHQGGVVGGHAQYGSLHPVSSIVPTVFGIQGSALVNPSQHSSQTVGQVTPHGASGVHPSAQAGYGKQGNSSQASAPRGSVGSSGFPSVQPPMGVMPAARTMMQQSSQPNTSELLKMLKEAVKSIKDGIASNNFTEKKQALLTVNQAFNRINTKEFQKYVYNRKPEFSEKLQEISQNLRRKNIHERLCLAKNTTLQNQVLQEFELPLLEIQKMVAVMDTMNLPPSLSHASYPTHSHTSQGGAVGAQAVGLVASHGASGVHSSAQAGYGKQGNSSQAPAPHGSVGSRGFATVQPPMGVMPAAMMQQPSESTISEVVLERVKKALERLDQGLASTFSREKQESLRDILLEVCMISILQHQKDNVQRYPQFFQRVYEIQHSIDKIGVRTLEDQGLLEVRSLLFEIKTLAEGLNRKNLPPSLPHASYPAHSGAVADNTNPQSEALSKKRTFSESDDEDSEVITLFASSKAKRN